MIENRKVQECLEAGSACVVACEECAEACMGQPEMMQVVKRCRDCIGVLALTMSFMARGSALMQEATDLAVLACQLCREECLHHDDPLCRDCARACRECERTASQVHVGASLL